jgi:hypothetical protein
VLDNPDSIEIRINKKQLANAERWYAIMRGGQESADAICKAVRDKFKIKMGIDPGFLEFQDINIFVKQEVLASA